MWVIFDWDEEGFKNFVSDPSVPQILHEAGFPRVQSSDEGQSVIYGDFVPRYESGGNRDLPLSLYVEAFLE